MNKGIEAVEMNLNSMETSTIAGATAGSNLDAAFDGKADKTEIVRLDAVLAGKESAGSVVAHNDSATAHPDIRADISDTVTDALSCHNSNANAHADLRNRVDSKVDKVTGMGLSSNDYTAEEKANQILNTSARHNHNNKTLLDSYTQTDASLSEVVTKKHSHENKSVLDGITSTLLNGWNSAVSHIADGVKHITATERTGWNAKADQVFVAAEMQNKANKYMVKIPAPTTWAEVWSLEPGEYTWVQDKPLEWQPSDTPVGLLRATIQIQIETGIGSWKQARMRYVDASAILTEYICEIDNGDNRQGRTARIATTTPPRELDLPLYPGFSKNVSATYLKTQDGVVHCYGSVIGEFKANTPTQFAVFPEEFRPKDVFAVASTYRNINAGTIGAALLNITSSAYGGYIDAITAGDAAIVYFSFSFLSAEL